MPGILVSIQTGLPIILGDDADDDPMERSWETGFFKKSVSGMIRLGTTNLDGDGQADLVNHGGPDKAACAYSADHYPYWREHLNKTDFAHGSFGENFTIAGLTESDVCIGDIYRLGSVEIQISQPRQPCWKLARRWGIKDLPAQVVTNGRTGWYFRVLQTGIISHGTELELLSRPNPKWTVARANEVMHRDKHNVALAAELVSAEGLSLSWRMAMERRTHGTPQYK